MTALFITRHMENDFVISQIFDETDYKYQIFHTHNSAINFYMRHNIDIIFKDYFHPIRYNPEYIFEFCKNQTNTFPPILFYNRPLEKIYSSQREQLFNELSIKYPKLQPEKYSGIFSKIDKIYHIYSFFNYLNKMYKTKTEAKNEQEKILFLLNDYRNEKVSVETLGKCLKNKKAAHPEKQVYACIHELRLKYEHDPKNPNILLNVGKGKYSLVIPN